MGCGASASARSQPRPASGGTPVAKDDVLAKKVSESSVTAPPQFDSKRTLFHVAAESASKEELQAQLPSWVPDCHPQADTFRRTLLHCLDLLAGGIGGVIVGVVDDRVEKDLQFSFLDNGLLMQLCLDVCPNVLQKPAMFQAVLRLFSAHNDSDRWMPHELELLASKLEAELTKDAASLLASLEGNPKDGAFILSQDGRIVAASAHLRFSSERFRLQRADGASCGTRHAASLGLAEWLGATDSRGAVFVRSDGGGVHLMVPRGDGPPGAYHFEGLRHRSQADMLSLFRDRIVERGQLIHKVQPGLIRPGIKGESVATCVNGRILSEVTISDDTSMVIRASTESKELYVLPREKFEDNWEQDGGSENPEFKESPFRLYKPKKGVRKWSYKITAADLELLPTGSFVASWGAVQPVRMGDFLAMPAPRAGEPPSEAKKRATEIYLMDPSALAAFACVNPSDGETRLETEISTHCTQKEMLDIFKEQILRDGVLMVKVEPCMGRPGKKGERVVTWVNPRIISDVTIQDDTSMVLRAPTIHHELYVLSQEKFLANWIPEADELDESDQVNKLLKVQGFKLYRPRPNKKWTYAVRQEDLERVPTGCFHASWGVLQPVKAGDYLAMPESANEVYLMPREVLTCYREVGAVASPSSPPRHRTQEEMVKLFAERIRARGRLVVKSKTGMLRPGRRGERVVTYVDGRVTSDAVIEDDTSVVVRAPTLDHEEYVLPWQKFEANWEPEGLPLDTSDPEMRRLAERGFRLHRPRPNRKRVYRLEAEDVALVPSGWFYSSWGALQPLGEGDYLSMPQERLPEVYLMPREVLDCYTECAPEVTRSLSRSCVCGNEFMDDSLFCRRCGAKRPEEEGGGAG